MIRRDRPDTILLAASLDGAPGIDLARNLRREQVATGIPIILMGEATYPDLSESDCAAAVDDFLRLPCNDAEQVSHLKTVPRLKTMRDELVSRRDTMRRYGVSCDVKGVDSILYFEPRNSARRQARRPAALALRQVSNDALTRGKPLSVGYFELVDMGPHQRRL